jgi:hypothetical protein
VERKTRLSIRIVGVNSGVVSVIQREIAHQLIGARIAHVPAIMGALFGSEELDGYLAL